MTVYLTSIHSFRGSVKTILNDDCSLQGLGINQYPITCVGSVRSDCVNKPQCFNNLRQGKSMRLEFIFNSHQTIWYSGWPPPLQSLAAIAQRRSAGVAPSAGFTNVDSGSWTGICHRAKRRKIAQGDKTKQTIPTISVSLLFEKCVAKYYYVFGSQI